MTIQVGQIAEDVITGFKGVVIIRTKYLHGVDRLAIQPRDLKDGKVRETGDFDITQLKLLSEPGVERVSTEKEFVKLGDKALCSISKIKGIVWAKATYLNGCTRVALTPEVGKDNKIVSEWFSEGQLSVVENEVIPEGNRETGGPAHNINDSWK